MSWQTALVQKVLGDLPIQDAAFGRSRTIEVDSLSCISAAGNEEDAASCVIAQALSKQGENVLVFASVAYVESDGNSITRWRLASDASRVRREFDDLGTTQPTTIQLLAPARDPIGTPRPRDKDRVRTQGDGEQRDYRRWRRLLDAL